MSERIPQVGHLYPRSGGGFLSLYVAMSGQVSARLMSDRYDIGYTTGLMPVASFWEMVDA
jgi:hypothetical protein